MALLARLLQLLRFLEELLAFLDILATPVGQIASLGVLLYGGLLTFGSDASTAATLAGSVALGFSCLLTRPRN
ncbi:hypothetical protein [Phormidium sp. FACHB-1136]|uniref:hypothetical protein n=1 Tax=Phormidium sp. FACHB-1136 TaxID=2692848 RepID=UPI0016891EED|nr:hypothetical protein [Phormidium sp. FACHB-1136]MBD2426566.1 hypothetical protein [Phormidium sp. FACHB-1136]